LNLLLDLNSYIDVDVSDDYEVRVTRKFAVGIHLGVVEKGVVAADYVRTFLNACVIICPTDT